MNPDNCRHCGDWCQGKLVSVPDEDGAPMPLCHTCVAELVEELRDELAYASKEQHS